MNQSNSDGSDPDDYESSWLFIYRFLIYACAAVGLIALCALTGFFVSR